MGAIADRTRRGRFGAVLTAVAIAAAGWAVAAPGPQRASAAPLNYIEVTSTCSLAEAIVLANAGSLNAPGNPSGGPTDDCPDHALGTTTIRITTNSGAVEHPTSAGVTAPGVALDPTVKLGAQIAGSKSMLPTITGNNITIEGDPTQPDPPNGYAIYALPAPPPLCFIDLGDGTPTPGCLTLTQRQPSGRILDIAAGATVTLRNLDIGGGQVAPGTSDAAAGGAIYSMGSLTLDHVTFLDNSVTGATSENGSGGAVYATAELTVRSSVFEGNTATGGARGGNALGGAIGLGPNATATISDSIFLTNSAYGGTGSPGSSGRNGKDGYDGRNGACDEQDTDRAAGADGGDGDNGIHGRDGDPGGNAIGVIAGGASISIDHSSFVDSVAVAGAAGVGGFGGNGGKGGNGGWGLECTNDHVSYFAPWDEWEGDGGNGGKGGDDGWNGLSGKRGTAVATVSANTADGSNDTDIRLVDVTMSGGSATVPADNFGDINPDDWYARRLQTLLPAAGSGGIGGNAMNGNVGATGAGGLWDTTILGRESLVGLGEADVFGAAGSTVAVSFSTIADIAMSTPAAEVYRADKTTPGAVTLASGEVKGSLLWTPGATGCPSVLSRGYNLFGSGGCQGSAGPTADDRVESARPVDADESFVGAVIRPANRPGTPYRMPTLPIRPGTDARNRAPQGSPTVQGPCSVLGTAGPLADDGRRSPRSDGFCDSGAYEEDGSIPFVTLTGPTVIYRDTPADNFVAVRVPAFPGVGTSLTVTVQGADGVEFPAGFVPTADDANPSFSSAKLDLTTGLPFPIGLAIYLPVPPAPADSVVVNAWIDGTASGTVAADPLTIAVRHDGQIAVTIDAPDRWSPCSGYLPITYTATSIGHSPAPPATIRVWPNVVRPTTANGLQTPVVEASAGSSALVLPDGSVLWSTPTVPAGAPSPTLRVYVALGVADLTQSFYLPGFTVRASATVSYAPGSPNDTFTVMYPDVEYISVDNDLDLLGGALSRTDGVPDPDVNVTAGTSSTLYATIVPGACGAPSTKPHDWGVVHVTVRDPETNTTLIDDLSTSNLAVAGNRWFPLTFDAPTTAGIHELEFTYTYPESEPATVLVPYTVVPVGVSVLDAGAAPESTATRTFTVQLDRPVDHDVTVVWKIVPGTATVADFVPQSGSVTILHGATTATFSATVVDDAIAEPEEVFFATIGASTQQSLPGGVSIVRSFGTATITNDDVQLSVADALVTEGNAGTTDLVFTLTSTLPNPRECSVQVTTVLDGTADAADLTAVDQELVVPGGTVAAPVAVAVTGDVLAERDETFHLRLTPTTGSTGTACGMLSATARGTIVDDDAATISIADTSVSEGTGAAGAAATFTIGLATAADHAVIVHATTSPGTAGASDFTATSVDVTIPAGATSATFTVPVTADAVVERNETFTVTLSAATGAPIGQATATGTIVDDDVPAVAAGAVMVTEGSGGGVTAASMPVTLDVPSPRPVTVTVSVTACAAVVGGAASATVTFEPGSTAASADVTVAADDTPEDDQACPVTVTAVNGALASGTTGLLTVIDDDAFALSGDAVVQVGEGAGLAHVTVTLSAPATSGGVTFEYATVDGTATSSGDYGALAGVATIPAGATSATIDVPIVDDQVHEDTESFSVVFTDPRRVEVAATALTAQATAVAVTVTIADDDPAPTASPGAGDGGSPGTPAAPGTGASPSSGDPELPITGADIAVLLAAALAALAIGLVLRRLRHRPAS